MVTGCAGSAYVAHIQRHALDRVDSTGPIRQHALYNTRSGIRLPSSCLDDHVGIDLLSEVCNLVPVERDLDDFVPLEYRQRIHHDQLHAAAYLRLGVSVGDVDRG